MLGGPGCLFMYHRLVHVIIQEKLHGSKIINEGVVLKDLLNTINWLVNLRKPLRKLLLRKFTFTLKRCPFCTDHFFINHQGGVSRCSVVHWADFVIFKVGRDSSSGKK